MTMVAALLESDVEAHLITELKATGQSLFRAVDPYVHILASTPPTRKKLA